MSEDTIFCGIFDGHGPYGHLVARKVRDTLPIKLHSALNSCASRQTEPGVTPQEKLNSLWREAFLKSYKAMDKELKLHPNLDCFCSGSTAVTIVKQVKSDRYLKSFFLPLFLSFLINSYVFDN